MAKKNLVVIGNGMVGHKFLERSIELGATQDWNLITFCEEPRLAYDRVNLSGYFSGQTAADLSLVEPEFYQENGVQVHMGDPATHIDPTTQTVTSAQGQTVTFDKLVLATGSYPFVPPIPGKDTQGTFVYRTIEDLEAMSTYAQDCQIGVVVGGGLLGLECANALQNMGLQTHVVEFAPRLMPMQVDEVGGGILKDQIQALGVTVHTHKSTTEIVSVAGRVHKMLFADGTELQTDMIVFSAGIRPRDEIARDCGLTLGDRGGITINEYCQTSNPNIYAIGECALHQGKIYGLVAPGYTMATIAAEQIFRGKGNTFDGADMSTKLKLLGVDVASFGDAFGATEGASVVAITDSLKGTYKKLVVDASGKKLLGGILVGDASAYGNLLQVMQNNIVLPPNPEDLILPARSGAGAVAGMGVDSFPDSAQICSCNNVTKGDICAAIQINGFTDIGTLKQCTKAGTGCGGCVPLVTDLLKLEMKKAGLEVKNHLCEHFNYSRQELYSLVRLEKIMTFADLLARHGQGRGCEICKPAVGSILASAWNEQILNPPHVSLQDTNDAFLANIQKDGTYSVIPRIPGGEVTPTALIALGEVARDFGLYTKITGGQRIDLLGARVDQLPLIWERLIAAGFESGHAYGKALRTVKSCVGSTWCRFGVQDSTTLAIVVEERYRGLRAPHKLKSAVSGCTRECAEAQSKDFGIIATENGWNLYVCGNGGMKPQHAQLLASDLNQETLIKYIDRFLMFYIQTANRLERTATWLNKLEGGMDYLKAVVVDDCLGIADRLEAEMAHQVATYECEWKNALADPQKRARFSHFVNSPAPDPSLLRVEERGQARPPYEHEREVLMAIQNR